MPVKVLIIDDNAVIRKLLTHLLSLDPGIEVVGTATDPFDARRKMMDLKPDVLTLDIEMPRMDGLTFLEKLMAHYPIPVVVMSCLVGPGSAANFKALELGATSVIEKPSLTTSAEMNSFGTRLCDAVKGASRVNLRAMVQARQSNSALQSQPQSVRPEAVSSSDYSLLAIGASTGGTEAIKTVLRGLPANIPATVIVQHMPPAFTKPFAERLNQLCAFEVREAQDGDVLKPGLALLAPGDYHMRIIVKNRTKWVVSLNQEQPMHAVRPAIDITFESVAKIVDIERIGVILTGMGKDGAAGLKQLRDIGARTIAQDEKSSVVYGMPRVAYEMGAVEQVLPLNQIAENIAMLLQMGRRSKIS